MYIPGDIHILWVPVPGLVFTYIFKHTFWATWHTFLPTGAVARLDFTRIGGMIDILFFIASIWSVSMSRGCRAKSDRGGSAARSGCRSSSPWYGSWLWWTMCSSDGSRSTGTARNGHRTFVRSVRQRSVVVWSGTTIWSWHWRWELNWWRRMAGSWWMSWQRWNIRRDGKRMIAGSFLVLLRDSFHGGFDCILHLFQHVVRVEECTGSRLVGCLSHRSWWFWSMRCGLRWRWSGWLLMEWKELLEMLDMGLSLRRQLLIQNGILLPEMSKLHLSLSLNLSLWLLAHHVNSTKLSRRYCWLRWRKRWSWTAVVPHGLWIIWPATRKHGKKSQAW